MESVVMLKFDQDFSKLPDYFKFRFTLKNSDEKDLFEFIFNSDFGLRIINNLSGGDFYFDFDLDFRQTTKSLFLVLHDR
jgi:hypothetical protein